MEKKQILRQLYATYVFFWLTVTSRKPIGLNVFDRDWDVLLLLDTCRVDALREVEDEYSFLEDIEEVWSVGSTSKEWVEQTFTEQYTGEIANTAYITGNPFSNTLLGERQRTEYGTTYGTWIQQEWVNKLIKDDIVDIESLGHLEPLWGTTGSDAPFERSQHPPQLTDYTIRAARDSEFDRVITHYMQPHSPYFSTSNFYDELEEYEKRPFEAIVTGDEEDRQQVWDAYIDNLRYVLDHIETLLENTDGTVVITADHGELLGDHGMHYHMPGNPHPKLKKVPWVEIETTDQQTYNPDVSLTGHENAEDVSEDQLEALGYL
jgi:hypothetical protein